MGFRSTITGQDYHYEWPDWFIDKYKDRFIITDSTLISSRYESKFYTNEVFEDIQRAMDWEQFSFSITYVLLHENSAITRIVISKDKITYNWMDEGYEADSVYMQG